MEEDMTEIVPHIRQPGGLVAEYPVILEMIEKQNSVFWTHTEIKMEKDIHDILVNMTEAERFGVIEVLRLFTKYEVFAGNEYWAGRFSKIYPRIEFQEMGACYSYFEQCVHKRFYQKTNELLHLHTNEFYNSFANEPILADRVKFLDDMINDPDHFLSVAVFSMVEGAILYSAFAFLKHFQSQGKNKVKALVSGIDFSVRDENCLSADTEVLTPIGWIKISDVSMDSKLLQYDTKTGECEFVHPTNLTSTLSDVSFVFESDEIHQIVTPNHRIITTSGEILAKDALVSSSILTSGVKKSGDDFFSEEDATCIAAIITGDLGVDWLYAKMENASSDWAEAAILYYTSFVSNS